MAKRRIDPNRKLSKLYVLEDTKKGSEWCIEEGETFSAVTEWIDKKANKKHKKIQRQRVERIERATAIFKEDELKFPSLKKEKENKEEEFKLIYNLNEETKYLFERDIDSLIDLCKENNVDASEEYEWDTLSPEKWLELKHRFLYSEAEDSNFLSYFDFEALKCSEEEYKEYLPKSLLDFEGISYDLYASSPYSMISGGIIGVRFRAKKISIYSKTTGEIVIRDKKGSPLHHYISDSEVITGYKTFIYPLFKLSDIEEYLIGYGIPAYNILGEEPFSIKAIHYSKDTEFIEKEIKKVGLITYKYNLHPIELSCDEEYSQLFLLKKYVREEKK